MKKLSPKGEEIMKLVNKLKDNIIPLKDKKAYMTDTNQLFKDLKAIANAVKSSNSNNPEAQQLNDLIKEFINNNKEEKKKKMTRK